MDSSTPYSLHDTKNVVTQAHILCYPDAVKQYVVYTDASNNACGTQLSQEHDGIVLKKVGILWNSTLVLK